ncbi:MAG: ribosome maturation factor RimM [Lachnospiraceae bacterium]|nr:ribosome maturation factor RimM [Lachnospiraceae bacterium]
MEDILRVGVITKTHGIRGEVKVFPTTDDPKRFKKLKSVLLDTGRERRKMEIEQVRFQKNLVILKFKGIDNINDVEAFKQCDLYVTRKNAVKLEENENFIVDLIGLKVVTDEGEEFGTMKDVMLTGANDVYVIETLDGEEVLFPAIPSCILDVDLDEEVMTVHIMPGLLD